MPVPVKAPEMSLPDLSGFEEEEVTQSPITEDEDEVFLIQVPKGFDINKLSDIKNYSPPGSIQIEARERKRGTVAVLELGSYEGKKLDVNLLINSSGNGAKAGPTIKQSLCVSKSVHLNPSTPRKKLPDFGLVGPVPMPTGLKPRYTPYGAVSPVRLKPKEHKKKKSKKRKASDEILDEPRSIWHPHKKRIKLEDTVEQSTPFTSKGKPDGVCVGYFAEQGDVVSPISSKKHKKKKKKERSHDNFDDPETSQNDSQISMNGLGFSDSRAWSRVNDQTFEETITVKSLDSSSHRKKKKRKSEVKDDVFDNTADCIPLNSSPEPSEQMVQTPTKSSNRKAKRKLSSGYQSLDNTLALDGSIPLDSDSDVRQSKKKKKKRKREELLE